MNLRKRSRNSFGSRATRRKAWAGWVWRNCRGTVLAKQSASAWAVTGDARLDLLIRLFYLGEAVAISQGEKFIPKEILRGLLTSGLLEREGEWLQPGCMLTPFGELILACDSWRSAEACAADLVLGVNPTTQLLARCSMLRPGGKALDLGTGCGTLALAAAPSAESVIGHRY